MVTWKDIQIATLQKMFAANGDEIPSDGSADDYLASMPFVANEALGMLATAGKYMVKTHVINHENTGVKKYDLKKLIEDYYDIEKIYVETDTSYTEYKDYKIENSVLIMIGVPSCKFEIYYMAYPKQITSDTPGSYEFPLDEEVAVLLPLYMASQLYKDDDNAIATTYRNEFEVAFERLNKTNVSLSFTSESGWI